MSQPIAHRAITRQSGLITIFITMVLLILVTIVVTTAFSLSTTNLRSVGNVQARQGAIAAAQSVIEGKIENADFQVLDPNSFDEIDRPVDLNGDGVADYFVTVAAPVCKRATQAIITSVSSVTLPGFTSASEFNTVWEFDAIATDTVSGAELRIIQGFRQLLSEPRRNQICI
ncbi:MAG: hypothetical protein ABJ084_15430 [Halioglobus sp.]